MIVGWQLLRRCVFFRLTGFQSDRLMGCVGGDFFIHCGRRSLYGGHAVLD